MRDLKWNSGEEMEELLNEAKCMSRLTFPVSTRLVYCQIAEVYIYNTATCFFLVSDIRHHFRKSCAG